MAELPKNLTRAKAAKDSSIGSFMHPLFGTAFDKDTFYEMFGKVLDQLDGASEADYVDFFFRRSPVEPAYLVYVDEDAQNDFNDWVVEEGCMPSEEESKVGETNEEKAARLAHEAASKAEAAAKAEADASARAAQKEKADAMRASLAADPALKAAQTIGIRVKSLDKPRANVAKASGPKREKLAAKLAKAEAAVEALVTAFREEYPDRTDLLPVEYGGEGKAMDKKATAAPAAAAAAPVAASGAGGSE